MGAVLTMSGVAIGLGNIWRFPYMMGLYGGSVFLFTYLAFVLLFGVPGLMAEWSLGRRTRSGPWEAYGRAGMPAGRLWSTILLITVVMASSYYAVVIGWVLQEAVAFAAAAFSSAEATSFATLTSGFGEQLAFLVIVVLLTCTVIALGVRRGIERVSKMAVPLFFVLFLALIVRVFMLENAVAGLQQFMKPQWENLTGRAVLAALGQAVFSLGLGGMFMVRYGSYMRDREDIPTGAVFTAVIETSAAMMEGLIIVPAVLALGMDLEGGPALMFEVMPRVFARMPGGAIVGAAFFSGIFVVALLSLIASYDIMVTTCDRILRWRRGLTLLLIAAVQIALAVPAYLVKEYIAKSDMIWGSTMQTFGAGIAVVAVAWYIGRSVALQEMREGSRLPVPTWIFYWIRYVLPAAIIVILVYGWLA